MLDIKKIIENKEIFSEGLSNRGYDISNLDILVELDTKRRNYISDGDDKRSTRNEISKKIGQEKRKPTSEESLFIKKLSGELKKVDEELAVINEKIKEIMLNIPNLPDKNVPIGED